MINDEYFKFKRILLNISKNSNIQTIEDCYLIEEDSIKKIEESLNNFNFLNKTISFPIENLKLIKDFSNAKLCLYNNKKLEIISKQLIQLIAPNFNLTNYEPIKCSGANFKLIIEFKNSKKAFLLVGSSNGLKLDQNIYIINNYHINYEYLLNKEINFAEQDIIPFRNLNNISPRQNFININIQSPNFQNNNINNLDNYYSSPQKNDLKYLNDNDNYNNFNNNIRRNNYNFNYQIQNDYNNNNYNNNLNNNNYNDNQSNNYKKFFHNQKFQQKSDNKSNKNNEIQIINKKIIINDNQRRNFHFSNDKKINKENHIEKNPIVIKNKIPFNKMDKNNLNKNYLIENQKENNINNIIQNNYPNNLINIENNKQKNISFDINHKKDIFDLNTLKNDFISNNINLNNQNNKNIFNNNFKQNYIDNNNSNKYNNNIVIEKLKNELLNEKKENNKKINELNIKYEELNNILIKKDNEIKKKDEQINNLERKLKETNNKNNEYEKKEKQLNDMFKSLKIKENLLEKEKYEIKIEEDKIEKEKYEIKIENEKIEKEKYKMKTEKDKIENEKYEIKKEKEKIENEKYGIKIEKEKIENEKYGIKIEKEKIENEKYEIKIEKDKIENEKYEIKIEKEKIENEKKKNIKNSTPYKNKTSQKNLKMSYLKPEEIEMRKTNTIINSRFKNKEYNNFEPLKKTLSHSIKSNFEKIKKNDYNFLKNSIEASLIIYNIEKNKEKRNLSMHKNKKIYEKNNRYDLNPKTEIIKKQKNKEKLLRLFSIPPLIGLTNLKKSQFINPILQCLSQTEDLTSYFLNENNINTIMDNNIALKEKDSLKLSPSYLELIQNLWKEKEQGHYYSPSKFLEIFEKIGIDYGVPFRSNDPNDIKEFIIFIIEQLHRELRKKNNNNEQIINQPLDQYDKNNSRNNFLRNFNEETSIISELFFGYNEIILQCLNCQITNKNLKCYNYEMFNCLIFPLEEVKKFTNNCNLPSQNNQITINDCFHYYSKTEYFRGDNKYYCNYCKKLNDTKYSCHIYDSPKILILVLNNDKANRNNIKIDFKETIDITYFVINKDNDQIKYSLYGVITYIKRNNSNPNFIASCKNPINKKWYRYNDEKVNLINDLQKEVINYETPYILFYKKNNK